MKNIVGAKENVCPHCQGTMLYIKINKAKVISQCKCGCTIDGRAKDEVRVWSYDPIKDNGNCKIKSNKSQELKKHLALDFDIY